MAGWLGSHFPKESPEDPGGKPTVVSGGIWESPSPIPEGIRPDDSGKAVEPAEGPIFWSRALETTRPIAAQETILEEIGLSPHPEASRFLRTYLSHPQQELRRAAVRGLAATGREADAQFLGDWMKQPGLAIEESTEAALALGGSRAPNATRILLQAYAQAEPPQLVQCLILGLAERPRGETQVFFRSMLGDPATAPHRKQEALQALGQFDTVDENFFLPYLQSPDPEVRSGAYLGLGVLREGNPGPRLLVSLQSEADPLARVSLLESLGLQSSGDPWAMSRIARKETDPLNRILAIKGMARSLEERGREDAAVQEFVRVWIPELARLAMGGSDLEGLQAVAALALRQKSPEAQAALTRIAQEAREGKVQAAAQRVLEKAQNSSRP